MSINDPKIQKIVDRIEKIGKIQESLADMKINSSQEEIDEIFQQIPQEYFKSKTKFDNFLQAIISNLFGGSHRERTTLLILEKLKDQIGFFFKNDEVHLIKIVEPYIFVNEWFYENNFLSIATIINESRYDSKLSQYFLPEIIENKPSLYYEYLLTSNPEDFHKNLYLPIKPTENTTSFTKKELDEIKNRRKKQIQLFLSQNRDFESYYSYDPNILRCSIMSDDIERFQNILSKNNISINSTCPPSIYDPSYFPKMSYSNETRTLIEAAALFGSVKIFKFLLLNDAELRPKEIFRRVLFGRNIDIFHIVENHIMKNAVLVKVRSECYKSTKDQKTQNYVNLYMNNPVSESDFKISDEESQHSSTKIDSDSEESIFDHELSDPYSDNEEEEEEENDEETSNNEGEEDKNDNKNDEKLTNDKEDNFVWVLKSNVHKNIIIKEHFSNCMMYSIKYGCDDISEYLYDNYETMVDFKIDTSIISEREVNFCLKNFSEKLLPIFIHYPNDRDEFDNTYLMNACYFNYPDIVKLLLKMPNIDVNLINPRNKSTAISRAADQHSYKTMEILLKSPLFKYTYSSIFYVTPFTKAAAHGYIDEILLLIDTKKNNENDERFKNMFSEEEIIFAFKSALFSNQSESIKVILNNFQVNQFFELKYKKIIDDASNKKCWDSLLSLLDVINENRDLYEQKFPDINFQDLIDLIQSKLKDEFSQDAIE